MKQRTISILAALADRPRSRRFRYRHSVPLAAQELGIPVSWIWFWIHSGRLWAKKWVWGYWVRLEDVRKALDDALAVHVAFEATGEPILSQATSEALRNRFPRLPREICNPGHPGKEVEVKSQTEKLAA